MSDRKLYPQVLLLVSLFASAWGCRGPSVRIDGVQIEEESDQIVSAVRVVEVSGLTDCLCGATRAGHFGGVAVVVTKLLLQCLPDRAYFGRKDYQQLMVVRRMVEDLNIPVDIRGIDTVREADGLAMSSRNWHLTEPERAVAPQLFGILTDIAETAGRGEDVRSTIDKGLKQLAKSGFGQVDYLEVRDAQTLELSHRPKRPARAFAAVYLGKARLIDNVPVDTPG